MAGDTLHASPSMPNLSEAVASELAQLREMGLSRELRQIDSAQGPRIEFGGREFLNFSSNDYLGFASAPELKEAAIRAIERWGVGSGASRLICGSLQPHHRLEEALAEFKNTEAALAFSSGYAAALGSIGALLGTDDVLVIDKLVHASVVDAARLSDAKLRVYPHNDLDRLESILKWATGPTANRTRRILIATESVFSMDGDLAPLRELVELKDKYGAWLMLDEAHGTGLFGDKRRGLAEAFELQDRIEVQMGTLGKALGVSGGFIAGSRPLIDLLLHRARSFVFSTAPPPAIAAAATAAIQLLQSPLGEDRRAALWSRVDQLKNHLIGGGWPLSLVQSAIIPLIVGDETHAVALATSLRKNGIFIPAIRYPTVARGKARLRVTLTAPHTPVEIDALAATLKCVDVPH